MNKIFTLILFLLLCYITPLFSQSNVVLTVWHDLNGDGIQDEAGTEGILGIIDGDFSLIDDATGLVATDALGNPLVWTDNGGGSYQWENVVAGDYYIQFATPAPIGAVPFVATRLDEGGDDTMDSDMDRTSLQSPVFTVVDGVNYDDVDAGFYVPGIVGDKVFCDKNGNGILDSPMDDDGVDGVTVTLFNSTIGEDPLLAADGVTPLTFTTGVDGMYSFMDVPPGNHQLRFSIPTNFSVTTPNAGGDETLDSDAIPINISTAETDPFELLSNETEEENRNDCGMWQYITLSGQVWLDDVSMDQMLTTEAGVAGVSVSIYDDMGTFINTSVTFGGGTYGFTNVPPGMYMLQIDQSSMDTGEPLNGTMPCSDEIDPIDPTDGDDNGQNSIPVQTVVFELLSDCDANNPPTVEHIDFCFFFDCNDQNPLAKTSCMLAEMGAPICDLSDLEGFCSRMFEVTSPGTQPGPLCPGGGAAHNISWFEYIAGEGSYTLNIEPFACNGSASGNEGVQIGIYTDCTFTESVFCDPNCSLATVSIPSNIFTPGESYYIFIDGCNGSVCSYNISVDGSQDGVSFAADDLCLDIPTGIECADITYCDDAFLTFVLDGLDINIDYTWSITTLGGGPYNGNDSPMTTEPELTIFFPNEGVYEVCMISGTNGCSFTTNPPVCRTITIETTPDRFFGELDICTNEIGNFDISMFDNIDPAGNGILGWSADQLAWGFGENSDIATLANGCAYKDSFYINELVPPVILPLTILICPDDLPYTFNGKTYQLSDFSGSNTLDDSGIVSQTPAANGCDSLIDLTLQIIRSPGVYETPICGPDGIVISYTPDPISPDWDVTYSWVGPSGTITEDHDSNPLTVIANQGDGFYNIVATIEVELDDGSVKTCVISEIQYFIEEDEYLPGPPTISGTFDVCQGSEYIYSAMSETAGVTFTWDVSPGATISVSGANNEIASIIWGTDANPTITLTSMNDCGESDIIQPITIAPPLIAQISTVSPVCIDSTSVISFVGDTSAVMSYTWTYNGGTVTNGSGQDGGPHDVFWSTADTMYVSMSYTDENGCVSTTALDSVIVVAPISPPTVMCDENAAQAGEVVFIWNDIPGVNYSFDIANPATDYTSATLMDTTLTVTGVAEDSTIIMTLISETGETCNLVYSLAVSCTAQDCTPASITINAEADTICENTTTPLQTLTLDIVPQPDPSDPGLIEFSGPGVDSNTGVFDASDPAVNVGANQILVSYTDADDCVASSSIVITVLPAPIANFSLSVDTICSNQSSMITYIGSGNPGTFTWDFDGGMITNATNGMGPGPHQVMWTTGGVKTVSVSLEDANSCTSSTYVDTVVVDELIPVPTPVCAPQLAGVGEVVFTWPDNPDVLYSIEVISDPSMYTDSILVDTMLTLTGVTIGAPITVILTTNTGGACGVLTSMAVDCMPGACNAPMISIEVEDNEVCEGDSPSQQNISITNINPAPPMGVTVDTVYGGPGVDPNTGVFDASIAGIGIHTVSVTYTDENGCDVTATEEINVIPKPTASFTTSADDICISDQITFSYNGTDIIANDSDYIWNFGDAVMPIEGGATPTVQWQSGGMKTVSLSVIVDGCQSDPFSMDVNVQNTLPQPVVSCIGQDDTGVTFEWTTVPGATEYSVEISYNGSVQSTEVVTTNTIFVGVPPFTAVIITVTPILGPDILCAAIASEPTPPCTAIICPDFTFTNNTTDTLICLNGSEGPIPLDFDVTNNNDGSTVVGTVTYTGQGAVQSDGTFDPSGLMPGIYPIQISVEETATGCLISGIINFTLLEQPISTFIIDNDDICSDDVIIVTFTGSGLGNNSPNWIVSGGTISQTATPNEYEWSFSSEGTFTIDLEINNNVCSDAAIQQTITVNEPQQIQNISCQSAGIGEIDIVWDEVSCASDYLVYIDGVQVATVPSNNFLATGLTPGNHDIEIQAISTCACDIMPGVNSGNCEALACPDQSAVLSANITEWCQDADDLSPVSIDVTFSGTDGTLSTPLWTGGDNNGNFDPSGLEAGEYTVSLSYQEPDCQLVEADIVFTILELPSANPMPDPPSCYLDDEGFVTFDPQGGVSPYTILLDGVEVDESGVVAMVGDHTADIIDSNGCMSSVEFSFSAPDPLAFNETDIQGNREVILNTVGTFSINPILVGGVDLDSIVWADSDGVILCSGPDCFSISEEFAVDREITVTIYYNTFCFVSTTFVVTTRMVTIIDVSNIISPNSDTANDEFVIFTNDEDIVFNSVHIFDRWGNLVKMDRGWSGAGTHTVWDGKYNATPVNPGVYLYVIEYVEDGIVKMRNGDITIIK